MDVGGVTSGASVPQPAAPSGADSAAGSSAADVRGAAPESAQPMDGYAAGSEAEAEEQQRQAATGPSEQPRNRRAKRRNGRQRQREAAWKNREAEHAAVMEDLWKTFAE